MNCKEIIRSYSPCHPGWWVALAGCRLPTQPLPRSPSSAGWLWGRKPCCAPAAGEEVRGLSARVQNRSSWPHQHLQLLSYCLCSCPTLVCHEQERARQVSGKAGGSPAWEILTPQGDRVLGSLDHEQWVGERTPEVFPPSPQPSWWSKGRFRSGVWGTPVELFSPACARLGKGQRATPALSHPPAQCCHPCTPRGHPLPGVCTQGAPKPLLTTCPPPGPLCWVAAKGRGPRGDSQPRPSLPHPHTAPGSSSPAQPPP